MKRYIQSSYQPGYVKQGFLFTFGNRTLFLESDMKNLTDNIIRKIINKCCDIKGVGDSIRQSALYDPVTLKDFRRRIDKCSLIVRQLNNGNMFYTIAGDNFSFNYPEEDFDEEVIVF